MKKIMKINITAKDPLVITDGSAESMGHKTLHYIPGNMLLGAYAYIWVRKHKNEDPDLNKDFQDLFINGSVSWGNGLPLCSEEPSVPVPLCFLKLKNHDGLPVIGQTNFEDCLVMNCISLEAGDVLGQESLSNQLWPDKLKEKNKIKKFNGGFMGEDSLNSTEVGEHFSMHVALNEGRTAANGQLFGFSSVNRGTKFISEIIFDESLEKLVTSLINEEHTVKIGHSRSAGYGTISISIIKTENLNKSYNSYRSDKVILYFKSPYASHNSYSDPFSSLEQMLRKIPGFVSIDDTRLYDGFRVISGFNGVWKLPRRSRNVIKEGSVFLINCEDSSEFIKSLPYAIGGDLQEGFGRFIVNPTFLLEQKPRFKAVEIKTTSSQSEKKSSIPLSKFNFCSRLLRMKCLKSEAEKRSISFVYRKDIQEFLKSQKNKCKISSSQRGIIRELITTKDNNEWQLLFNKMLEKKSFKDSWENAEGYNPFIPKYKNDEMSSIMSSFLSQFDFAKLVKVDQIMLPGGLALDSELSQFKKDLHKLSLLRLLKEWDYVIAENQNGDRG